MYLYEKELNFIRSHATSHLLFQSMCHIVQSFSIFFIRTYSIDRITESLVVRDLQ